MQLYLAPLLLLLAQLSTLADAQPAPTPPGPPPPPLAAAPLIEVTPPLLTVQPNQASCPMQVKLKKKPAGPVSVYMHASNMGFSSCELKFDENNWDKAQEVQAIPLPYFTDATVSREVEGTFKIAALKDPSMNKNELKYKIVRDKGKAAICDSNGDPHYMGFNGMKYDFLSCPGNFYLLKSDFLTIQTTTKKWINNAHVNEAMALRFGKTVYIVHADKGLSCASASRDGVEVIESPNKKDFHFKLSDGSEVKVAIGFAQMNFLNIIVELAEHAKGKVNGLCGKWVDGDQKFYGPDNQVVATADEWGRKWAVPENENIFACTDKCPSAANAQPARPIQFCQIPAIGEAKVDPPYKPPPQGYTVAKPPAYGNGGGYKVPVLGPIAQPKEASPEHKKKCEELCAKVIQHQLAEKYLDSKPYLSNCVADCCLTGTFEPVEGQKTSYFAKLRTFEKTLMSAAREAQRKLDTAIAASTGKACGVKVAPPPPEMQANVKALFDEVNTLRNTFGLGGAKCPGGGRCSGNGECRTAGCACKKGFTGIDCTFSLSGSGYTVTGNVLTATAYTPKAPKPVPPCKQAALALAAQAAKQLAKIPSLAAAINKKNGVGR